MSRYPTVTVFAAAILAFALTAPGLSMALQDPLFPSANPLSTRKDVAPGAVSPRLGPLASAGAKAASAYVIPTIPLSTPQLLGSVKRQDNGIKALSPNSTWRITMAEDVNGFGFDIGNDVRHYNGVTGVYNFTQAEDVDFLNTSTLLTNGVDDPMEFVSSEKPTGAANWSIGTESSFFHTAPDFLGYAIDSFCLVVQDLHIYPANGTALEFANYTWQVWGHRVFVAFAPPSDPNGAYLFDRDYTNVTVSLAGSGNASVEWDGVNRTMFGGGRSWYINLTGISNGDHEYRVWANDTNGTVYSSEARHIAVAYHYWSVDNIGAGSGPGLATDHNGMTHLCYEDASGYVRYATHTSTGWSVQTVAYGGRGYCSIAVDVTGNPHLLFGSLKYAVLAGSTWAITTISSAPITRGASLALNPITGRPMAAFYDGAANQHDLVFQQQAANGSWSSMPVDRNGDTGWMPSMVVNSKGTPAIAYSNSIGDVLYANLTGGTWSTTVINKSSPLSGLGRISLALDSNDTPHIAYAGGGPRYGTVGYIGLEYASPKGANWTNETVYPGPTEGVSLLFDAQDHPRIAFGLVGYPVPFNGTLRDLRYAVWNGTWQVATLSHTANATGVALSVSPGGVPQIAATSWWNGGGATQGMLQFYRVDVGLFATFDPTPVEANTSAVFRFDPSGSYDTYFPTSSLEARWDFNGDGVWDTGWTAVGPVTHTYATSARYTVFLQLRDPSNLNATAQKQVIVDSVPPVTTAQLGGKVGSSGWYTSSVNVTLNATDDLTHVTATMYSLDGSAWTAYTAPFAVSTEGNHTVQYYSIDSLGNKERLESTSFRIDTIPPTASDAPSGTPGIAGWYISNVQVTLNVSDAGSGVATISYLIDGGATQMYTAPFTLTDGTHTIEYWATDVAGNSEPAKTKTVKVDTKAPVLSYLTPNGTITVSSVVVSWSGSDSGSGIADYQISIDQGSFQPQGTATSKTVSLADGDHTITVRAVDAAGNQVERQTQVHVDTNFLSFTGPFKGVPALALLLFVPFVAILLLLLLLDRRRERKQEKGTGLKQTPKG